MANLNFTYFPDFAKFLLGNKLDELVRMQLVISREVEIPLLKLLEQMPEEQLLELSKNSTAEILSYAIDNHLSEQIKVSVKQWKENLLPVIITREQVVADDITLASIIRKRSMLYFLPEYTDDLRKAISIIREIDEWIHASEAASFETFVNIQQEALNKSNIALQQSEELYKQAQALTHIGNWSWYIETGKIVWSDEMYRIYGLEPQSEEITFERFTSLIHPDDRQWRIDQIKRAIETRHSPDYTMRVVKSDGSLVVLEGKNEVVVKDGKPYKMGGTCRDITSEYYLRQELVTEKMRLADTNESLAQKNKELERSNKELTSFSYVASHDLQEPLRKIMMFSQLLTEKESGSMSDRGRELFGKIHASALSMKRLIEDLLSYSRVQSYTEGSQIVDLNAIVKEIKQANADSYPENELQIRYSKLPSVKGVSFQLHQLFENIIGNAIKYAKPDLPPQIDITSEVVKGKDIKQEGVNPNADYYQITLADNGIGFEQEYAVKVFEIFQRLHPKAAYTGTGIGLAICKKIVQNHHGFIEASSSPGQGAEFRIYLPV